MVARQGSRIRVWSFANGSIVDSHEGGLREHCDGSDFCEKRNDDLSCVGVLDCSSFVPTIVTINAYIRLLNSRIVVIDCLKRAVGRSWRADNALAATVKLLSTTVVFVSVHTQGLWIAAVTACLEHASKST